MAVKGVGGCGCFRRIKFLAFNIAISRGQEAAVTQTCEVACMAAHMGDDHNDPDAASATIGHDFNHRPIKKISGDGDAFQECAIAMLARPRYQLEIKVR